MASLWETPATADVAVQRRDMTGRRSSQPISVVDDSIPMHPMPRKSSLSAGRTFPVSHFARRTVGIGLLFIAVFLWTASNFSANYVPSDQPFAKPFFAVYTNTFFFALSAVPLSVRYVMQNGGLGRTRSRALRKWRERFHASHGFRGRSSYEYPALAERLLASEEEGLDVDEMPKPARQLSLLETARFSLKFSVVWFLGNYLSSACLEYTSVTSVAILTSTSGAWTLIFCSMLGIETFSTRKLVAVMASLSGVILVSLVDLYSGPRDGEEEDPGAGFPRRSQAQVAIGDAMAFLSAICYGVYVVMMKVRVGSEDRINMPLFFCLVGAINALSFWPLFFILHYTGIEPFEWPPNSTIWTFLLLNSLSCLVSDVSWSYAMLLTTPLVSTVGFSLTIPLSLIGEMIHYGQYPSPAYWMGAGVVLMSFLFINQESSENETPKSASEEAEWSK